MLLEMHRNAVSQLVKMEMEAFEQTISLKNDGDGGFVKIYVIGIVPNKFIKENKILQPNILNYFYTNFNVIQRTMIVM